LLRDTNVLKRRDIEHLSTSGVSARSFAFTPGHLGNAATTREAAMETREQEELRVDAGETLRNPLLAFIGQHHYAPPAPGQAPSVAWQADPEGRALWLPRLAEQLHMDMPDLRAALYDVTSCSATCRNTICEHVVRGAVSMYGETAKTLQSQYGEYCKAADWARLRANRHVLVVDGVALYDAYALKAMLDWFSWTGWKYRLMDARLAAVSWDRRLYTTEEALRCWLSGRPRPPIPSLRAAVHAAGCSRKLSPGEAPKLSGKWGGTWVEFLGERFIWGSEVVRLYLISATAQRRARREGRLEAGIVYGSVLISFESLQRFLKWWYAHDCTWRGDKKAKGVHNEQ
jgi:hypothetical protein